MATFRSEHRTIYEYRHWLRRRSQDFQVDLVFRARTNVNGAELPLVPVLVCGILGEIGTIWENSVLTIEVIYDKEKGPPICRCCNKLNHPNILPFSGTIQCSVLNVDWHDEISLLDLLLAIRDDLTQPNAEHYRVHPHHLAQCTLEQHQRLLYL